MKILWKKISQVSPGDTSGDDVFDPNSFVLLIAKGTILDSKTLEFLKSRQVTWIPIGQPDQDELDEDSAISVESEIYESNALLAPELPLVLSEEVYHKSISRFHDLAGKMMDHGIIDSGEVINLSNDLVNEVARSHPKILNFVAFLPAGFLVKHSVNTAIMGVTIAHHLKQPRHVLVQLAKTALLHDIGLIYSRGYKDLRVGEDIEKQYNKRATRNILIHPIISVKMIRTIDEAFMEKDVEASVMQHHERYDGTGFPIGIKGKNIAFLARVLAVADAYDTLISSHTSQTPIHPYEALRWVISHAGSIFDPDMVRAFVEIAGVYPTGTVVRLNDQRTGKVISRGDGSVARPILLVQGEEVELEKIPYLYITEVLGFDAVEKN